MPESRTTRYYENRTPSAQQTTPQQTTVAIENTIAQENQVPESNMQENTLQTSIPQETVSQRATSQETMPQAENLQNLMQQTPVPIVPEAPREELSNVTADDTFFPDSSEGQLLVTVQTARGSFPVSEATVIVYRNRNGSGTVENFQLTDASGKTPSITLAAPPKADAQAPSGNLPFADYNITVRHPLYYTAVIDDVQVFGGEQTILTVDLIPLPEFVNETDITKTITIPKQNL